jgi:Zn-dependent peptidase ImmA (M78 family)/transcriptional regulator with XRE-family HTH domain
MPRSIPALVRPALLIWAREKAGFKIQDAAAKADVEIETLRSWERGESLPTISQLRKLGEVYKRPIAVFFLPSPPTDFDAQREFRRLPGLTPEKESPQLRLALRLALFRREAALNLYRQLGEPIPKFNAKAQPHEDPETVGIRLRKLLGITWQQQLAWTNAYVAFNAWRNAIERLGILIFQTGDVELKEMRGTSVPHGPLPVIVLNNTDAPHGRIFSLLHEFVHILLANGGHNTSAMEGKRLPEDQLLERVSNRIAAAALMPREEFLAEVSKHHDALIGDESALNKLAARIKASPEAIFRRLVSLHKVTTGLYRKMRREWQNRSWFTTPSGDGGPTIEVRIVSALGRAFTSLVLEGFHRNAVSASDVSDYLGIQLKFIDRIEKQLLPGPGQAAFG